MFLGGRQNSFKEDVLTKVSTNTLVLETSVCTYNQILSSLGLWRLSWRGAGNPPKPKENKKVKSTCFIPGGGNQTWTDRLPSTGAMLRLWPERPNPSLTEATHLFSQGCDFSGSCSPEEAEPERNTATEELSRTRQSVLNPSCTTAGNHCDFQGLAPQKKPSLKETLRQRS